MYLQVANYALLDSETLALLGGGWPNFKHAFVRMMIETGKDFSLRSVVQVSVVGPPLPAADDELDLLDDEDEIDDAPLRKRHSLAASAGEAQSVTMGAPMPPRRQTMLEMVQRFGGMRSWESSDHPVVVFKMSPLGHGVDGVDLLTLNQAFVNNYIDHPLRQELEASGIDFAKDWNKVRWCDREREMKRALNCLRQPRCLIGVEYSNIRLQTSCACVRGAGLLLGVVAANERRRREAPARA